MSLNEIGYSEVFWAVRSYLGLFHCHAICSESDSDSESEIYMPHSLRAQGFKIKLGQTQGF